jgi:TolB protein
LKGRITLRPFGQLPLLAIVLLFLMAGIGFGQIVDTDTPATGKKGPTLVGTWHSLSFSMSLEDGKRRTLSDDDGAVSLIVAQKTFTLRLGTKILTDMTYVADRTKSPCTIDLKSKNDEMLGIYKLDDGRLTISLNDKAKGRPKDFDEQSNGMVVVFRPVHPVALYTINADGKRLRRVLLLRDFTFVGSAEWSPDGRTIALDSWRPTMGETCSDARIFTVNADGSSFKDLGPGAMPSWSPDGTQLVCSQYGKQNAADRQRGIWIMNADGTGYKLIDASGWGAQWSPKRNEIAYVVYNNNNAVFKICDVDKTQYRSLEPGKPYSQITWGFTWSADGKWLAFRGTLNGGESEFAAVPAEEGKKGFKILLSSSVQPEAENSDATIAWRGVGSPLLISTQSKGDSGGRLYLFESADGSKPPKAFPRIPASWIASGPAWSSDGKKLVFSAVELGKTSEEEKDGEPDPFAD